jgi:hypothetical protein
MDNNKKNSEFSKITQKIAYVMELNKADIGTKYLSTSDVIFYVNNNYPVFAVYESNLKISLYLKSRVSNTYISVNELEVCENLQSFSPIDINSLKPSHEEIKLFEKLYAELTNKKSPNVFLGIVSHV